MPDLTNTYDLRIALGASDGLVASAQDVLTKYLVPDGYSPAEALDRLIALFDGPRQRKVQAMTAAALKGESTEQWKTHFNQKEKSDA